MTIRQLMVDLMRSEDVRRHVLHSDNGATTECTRRLETVQAFSVSCGTTITAALKKFTASNVAVVPCAKRCQCVPPELNAIGTILQRYGMKNGWLLGAELSPTVPAAQAIAMLPNLIWGVCFFDIRQELRQAEALGILAAARIPITQLIR